MRLVITGGGTGGHIFAGVAIAQEFLSQSKSHQVLFVGSESGLETKLVPKAGFKLETLKLGKLVGQGFFVKLKTLFQIPCAIASSIRILRAFKPDIVLGVGGFAAGPCIIAAKILRIPTGVLEQNSVVGLTNRISAKFADKVFLAFDEVPQGIERAKCLVTGNPARSHLTPAGVKSLSPFVLFIFGGSQGATGINQMMTEAAEKLVAFKDQLRIIHQTGPRDFEWVKEKYEKLHFPAEVHPFIDDMQSKYNLASLVICRAGSGTISELASTKNAAVLIPFPLSAGDHQTKNARTIEKLGAARVLLQGQSTGLQLAEIILELRNDPQGLVQMREKMAYFHKPLAAKQSCDLMKTTALLQKKSY